MLLTLVARLNFYDGELCELQFGPLPQGSVHDVQLCLYEQSHAITS
jgi:hypothetical protein